MRLRDRRAGRLALDARVHPIWEGPRGWIATGRRTPKARHLAHEPRFSLTYWDAGQEVLHVRRRASWTDDQPTRATRQRRFVDLQAVLVHDLSIDDDLVVAAEPEDVAHLRDVRRQQAERLSPGPAFGPVRGARIGAASA